MTRPLLFGVRAQVGVGVGTAGPTPERLSAGLTSFAPAVTVRSPGGERWKNRPRALRGGGGALPRPHPVEEVSGCWLPCGLRPTQ